MFKGMHKVKKKLYTVLFDALRTLSFANFEKLLYTL